MKDLNFDIKLKTVYTDSGVLIMRKYAFTLIEIMIVVAIIGLLAMLAIPAALKAREAARRVKCVNSLREIGNALQMYAGDHAEEFPVDGGENGSGVMGLLYSKYLDTAQIFACPSDVSAYTNIPAIGGGGFLNNSSYAYNEGLKATDKSQTPIVCDRGVASGSVGASAPHYPNGVNVLFIGCNVAWVDATGGSSANLPTSIGGDPVDWSDLID